MAAVAQTPILIGSGITAENLADYQPHADAVIVGSYVKQGGHWANAPDPARIRALMTAL